MDDLDRKRIIELVKKIDDKITWKTYTSIFIGVSPFNMSSTTSDDKGMYVPIKVFNPIEKREQEEKLREGKALGIVIRRTSKFGWASQPYVMQNIPELFARDIPVSHIKIKRSNKKLFDKNFTAIVSELINSINIPVSELPFPNFEKEQVAKLRKMQLDDVRDALWKIVKTTLSVGEFKFVVRTYGGNANRYAVTFETLNERFGIDVVPEQFGDKYSKYLKKNRHMIIGYEKLQQSGKESYIRLVPRDVPKGVFKKQGVSSE